MSEKTTPEATSAIAHHDLLAATWDHRYQSGAFGRRAALFRDRLLPMICVTGTWLDAGCGSGHFSRIIAREGAYVVGLDASKAMVEAAHAEIVAEGLEASVRVDHLATIESIPFPASSFDGCICLSVLEYLEQPSACLDEITRVLKTKGWLILSVPNRQSPVRRLQQILKSATGSRRGTSLAYLESSRFSVTRDELFSLLAERGMTVLHTLGFDAVLPEPLHRVLPPSLIYVLAQKQA